MKRDKKGRQRVNRISFELVVQVAVRERSAAREGWIGDAGR